MSDFSKNNISSSLGAGAGSNATAGMEGLATPTPKAQPTNKATTGEKRRGPNSHRVRSMFAAIGTERVPLEELIRKHNVSMHVARQSKRFDPHRDRGQVVIKTLPDETTGNKCTYIWRVPPTK